MGISRSQLDRLSQEDRTVYKQWLRGGVLFYGTLTALLIFSSVANQLYRDKPDRVAGMTAPTAGILAARN